MAGIDGCIDLAGLICSLGFLFWVWVAGLRNTGGKDVVNAAI